MKEERIPLDELMVAMDAVDALRHKEGIVQKELGSEERRKRFIEKLKAIYAEQGIEVTDEILEEGVKALEEERFTFHPAKPGLKRWLAELYVGRGRWLKPLLLSLGLLGAGGIGYYAVAVYPEHSAAQQLPKTLHQLYSQITTISRDEGAQKQANLLIADAKDALAQGDIEKAKAKKRALEFLLHQLRSHYTIRIVQGAQKRSGIWRIPPHNPTGKNYYIIVEAVDENGNVIPVSIHNEENDAVEQVRQWGLRVDKETYEKVKRDKLDDGIIQHRIVGSKERGKRQPNYRVPSNGSTITQW